MARTILYRYKTSAPPGLTPIRQVPHKFQEATTAGLELVVLQVGDEMLTDTKAQWPIRYPEGYGTTARSLKVGVTGDRLGGVQMLFSGSSRPLPYLTTLGGGQLQGETQIAPNNSDFLVFFWKRMGRMVRIGKPITHPAFTQDFLLEQVTKYSKVFGTRVNENYQRGIGKWIRSLGTPPSSIKR